MAPTGVGGGYGFGCDQDKSWQGPKPAPSGSSELPGVGTAPACRGGAGWPPPGEEDPRDKGSFKGAPRHPPRVPGMGSAAKPGAAFFFFCSPLPPRLLIKTK